VAMSHLGHGDVILLEQQSVVGPHYDPATQRGLAPIEFQPDVFAAIKKATSSGIIVVEAGGNGSDNLDDPAYKGVFDRNRQDSGAIIVGAGWPPAGIYGPGPDRAPIPESNYGSRQEVQRLGPIITTFAQ